MKECSQISQFSADTSAGPPHPPPANESESGPTVNTCKWTPAYGGGGAAVTVVGMRDHEL